MKENIKNNELRERLTYPPVSVEVIEVTAQKIICQSGIINEMILDEEDGGNGFY